MKPVSEKRRSLLKGTLATGALGVAVGSGLLAPSKVFAAWPADAMNDESLEGALQNYLGTSDYQETDEITIQAPDIAENGAVVPITMETTMDNVESMTLLVEKNPAPMVSAYEMGNGAHGYASQRIRMGETSDVYAVVKRNGQLYAGIREVKVTIGGCGG